MAYEQLKNATLSYAISNVVADVADLAQKEFLLAKAELSQKLSTKLQAGIWMSAAGLLAIVVVLLLVEALVFGIASFGIALHWSCLIVAAVLAVIAAGLYFKGRSDAQGELTPSRTIHQIQQDISIAKERLS